MPQLNYLKEQPTGDNIMKKGLSIFAVMLSVFFIAVADDAKIQYYKQNPDNIYCLSRGLGNLTTGYLEIPRCMIYDNDVMPVFGLFVGIPEGAGFTVARVLSGVYDFVSFGYSGDLMHSNSFPDLVFNSKWHPAAASKK